MFGIYILSLLSSKKKKKRKSYTEHNDIIMKQNGQFCTAFLFV